MLYEILIKDGYNEDMWLSRTFPNTQFEHDHSKAIRMTIEQCSRNSNYLMQVGISHTINQAKI